RFLEGIQRRQKKSARLVAETTTRALRTSAECATRRLLARAQLLRKADDVQVAEHRRVRRQEGRLEEVGVEGKVTDRNAVDDAVLRRSATALERPHALPVVVQRRHRT